MERRTPALPRPTARAFADGRGWLVLSWGIVAVFAAGLCTLLLSGRWAELRMASAFFLPLLALMLLPHGLPPLLVALGAACSLVSAAGWALDWYALLWWFDVLLHALNPFALTAGSMVMFWKAGFVSPRGREGRFVLLSAAYGLAIGTAWELVELTFLTLTWPDTILDLAMDAAGAALGGWLAAWLIAVQGRPPVGRRPSPLPVPARIRR